MMLTALQAPAGAGCVGISHLAESRFLTAKNSGFAVLSAVKDRPGLLAPGGLEFR